MQKFRLVLLGSARVGKTAIIKRFLENRFPHQYKPTVEDLYCKEVQIDEFTRVRVDILDTAGNHEFPAMRRLSISNAQAFLIVFSMNDQQSVDEAQNIWRQIKDERPTDYHTMPVVFVGNKDDLENSIDEDLLQSWLQTEGMDEKYVQASAKTGFNVLECYVKLLQQAKMPGARTMQQKLNRRVVTTGSLKDGRLAVQTDRTRRRSPSPRPFAIQETDDDLKRSRSLLVRVSLRKKKAEQKPDDCSIM